jgi:hypothetical protein
VIQYEQVDLIDGLKQYKRYVWNGASKLTQKPGLFIDYTKMFFNIISYVKSLRSKPAG